MQSLLALVGAISLQSGAKQDAHKVEEGMRDRIETILGDGFDKRLRDQQESDTTQSCHQDERARLRTRQSSEGKVTKVRNSRWPDDVERRYGDEYDICCCW